MSRVIMLLLIVLPFVSNAQQLRIYTDADGYKYFALYAYGLPREVVKTNQEIRDMKYGDTGIVRRHHTTSYVDEGIGPDGKDANSKVSFAFLIAPFNVDAKGVEIPANQTQTEIGWYDASGWDPSMDCQDWAGRLLNNLSESSIVNPTPTGCAAYRGPKGEDEPGSWRLPTQREALTMFTIMEHALTMQGAESVVNNIINGKYWTATELKTSANWRVWFVDSDNGSVVHQGKVDPWGFYSKAFARCVKDIDNDPINEQ